MKKSWIAAVFGVALLCAGIRGPAKESFPQSRLVVKLRIIAGFAQGDQTKIFTSYYLKPIFSGSIATDFSVDREIAELRKVFNLNSVRLLDEAELAWTGAEGVAAHYHIHLGSSEYRVSLRPTPGPQEAAFTVQVLENPSTSARNLLDTRIVLPYAQAAILGFEDSEKRSFFISFHVVEGVAVESEAVLPKGGVRAADGAGTRIIERRPILPAKAFLPRRIGESQIPPLKKKVEPVYSQAALTARIQGTVELDVAIDENGRVVDVSILSGHPLLNGSAVSAERQCQYRPYVEGGQALAVHFTVYHDFVLKGDGDGARQVKYLAESMIPRRLRFVEPAYPAAALKAGVQGRVTLELTTNSQGRVADVRVISGHALLNAAAIDCVRQWSYEPYSIEGKFVPVRFQVSLQFILNQSAQAEAQAAASASMKAVSGTPVRLLHRVEPRYPSLALARRIEGFVVLEARTDVDGLIESVRIIEGRPELNGAAVEAIRQWRYAPYFIEGRALPLIIRVTVHFQLSPT